MNASVLVVDGDPEIRKAIEAVLSREGYDITCSGSVENALERLEAASFEAVITDIRMPGISGIEFLERIREKDAKVQIIVLTGFITVQNIIKALRDVGAADYLTKPLDDMADLVSSVKKALEKQHSQKTGSFNGMI